MRGKLMGLPTVVMAKTWRLRAPCPERPLGVGHKTLDGNRERMTGHREKANRSLQQAAT